MRTYIVLENRIDIPFTFGAIQIRIHRPAFRESNPTLRKTLKARPTLQKDGTTLSSISPPAVVPSSRPPNCLPPTRPFLLKTACTKRTDGDVGLACASIPAPSRGCHACTTTSQYTASDPTHASWSSVAACADANTRPRSILATPSISNQQLGTPFFRHAGP